MAYQPIIVAPTRGTGAWKIVLIVVAGVLALCFLGGTVVAARPRFDRYTVTGVSVSNVNGAERGSVGTRIFYGGGSTDSHDLVMVNENGWKVCGDPY